MSDISFTIHTIAKADKEWVTSVVNKWGGFIMTRGRKAFPDRLPGFIAKDLNNNSIGLVTYEIFDDECEIVTLDAFEKYQGIGTALIEAVENQIKSRCKRLWLITTNDNVDAIRFYQKRGFSLNAVYPKAVNEARKIKPAIPIIGNYGIAVTDELEFEKFLS